MRNAANTENIKVADTAEIIEPFLLGSMTDTIYAVGGAMEDWVYAAGFDTGVDASFNKCKPATRPELDNSFYESTENVRSAVYLIETSDLFNPSVETYGGRDIIT